MALANIVNEPTLAPGVATKDFRVNGSPFMVLWHLDDATAAGDLGLVEVRAYAKNGTTLLPNVLTPTSTEAKVFSSPVVAQQDMHDVMGYDRIQVTITNGAGSARDVQVDVGFIPR